MPIVEAKIEVEAAQGDVFDLAQDYDLRLRWDPFLREMKFVPVETIDQVIAVAFKDQ